MPALPAPGPVIRVDLHFTVGTDANALTRWFMAYFGSPPAIPALTSFTTALNGYCDDALPPLMHSDTTYTGCTITDLATDTGASLYASESSAGSRDGAALGADVCLLANFTVDRRYRGGKPRGYWPLGTASDLETRQTWTSDFLAAAQTPIENIYGQLTGDEADGCTVGQNVNVSYYGPPNRFLTGSTGRIRTVSTVRTTPILDAAVGPTLNPKLGSQRRRNLIRT
jgi:hypothetical protein